MTTYCRPGPGCNVHAWSVASGYGPSMYYFLRFGSALEKDLSEHDQPHLTKSNLDLFMDVLGALRRAGFLIPDVAFARIDAEVKARDEAVAAEKARQIDMFAEAK